MQKAEKEQMSDKSDQFSISKELQKAVNKEQKASDKNSNPSTNKTQPANVTWNIEGEEEDKQDKKVDQKSQESKLSMLEKKSKKELRNVASEGRFGSQIDIKPGSRNQQSEEAIASPRYKKMMSQGIRQFNPEGLDLEQKLVNMPGLPSRPEMVSKKKTAFEVGA